MALGVPPFLSDAKDSLYVENSQQLWYALEHNYIPICKSGSMAEYVFDECKKVLIKIIKDDMTDYEKIFVISNYLNDISVYGIYYGYKRFAEGILFDGGGTCHTYAKAMLILLSIEGIQCKIDFAYNDKENMNSSDHVYNYVFSKEDGLWYLLEAHQDLYLSEMSYRGIMNGVYKQSVLFDNLPFSSDLCQGFWSHLKWGNGKSILLKSNSDLNALLDFYNSHDNFQLPIEYYSEDIDLLSFVKNCSMDYLIRSENILNLMKNEEIIILKRL